MANCLSAGKGIMSRMLNIMRGVEWSSFLRQVDIVTKRSHPSFHQVSIAKNARVREILLDLETAGSVVFDRHEFPVLGYDFGTLNSLVASHRSYWRFDPSSLGVNKSRYQNPNPYEYGGGFYVDKDGSYGVALPSTVCVSSHCPVRHASSLKPKHLSLFTKF